MSVTPAVELQGVHCVFGAAGHGGVDEVPGLGRKHRAREAVSAVFVEPHAGRPGDELGGLEAAGVEARAQRRGQGGDLFGEGARGHGILEHGRVRAAETVQRGGCARPQR